MEIQKRLFTSISSQLKGYESLPSSVGETLNISKSTAYKKIRGEIGITMDEFSVLVKTFKVPVHSFLKMDGVATFQIDGIKHEFKHPLDYFQQMGSHFDHLTQFDDLKFVYLSNELPIFHLLHFPALLSVKVYLWDLTNWKTGFLKKKQYHTELFRETSSDFEKIRSSLLKKYLKNAGVEIWSVRMLDILIEQIKFLIGGQLIKTVVDINNLIAELEMMLDYLIDCCENGLKRSIKDNIQDYSEITIYHNQIIDSSTLILAKNTEVKFVYSMFDTPNFLNCYDPQATEHIEGWLDNVVCYSKKISKEGALDRRQFIMQVQRRVNMGIEDIKTLAKLYYADYT